MSWLATAVLTNAITAMLLAIVVWAISRMIRWPALTHLLWVIVLLKLLTPPLVEVPLGLNLGLTWPMELQNESSEASIAEAPAVGSADGQSPQPAKPPVAPSLVPQHAPVESAPGAAVAPISQVAGAKRPAARITADRPAASRGVSRVDVAQLVRSVADSLPFLWLVGCAGSLLVFARRAWAFQAFLRGAGYVDTNLRQRVETLARAAGLSSAPTVIALRGVVSPMLWGVGRRTVIIFPEQLLQNLSPVASETLLLHELAHYARGDQWVRLVELLASVVFWWHPVVWWARHEIEAAEEQCCDAWVINARVGSRRTYAEALLATIDFLYEQPVLLPPTASGLGSADLLRVRLTQIMRGELATNMSAGLKWLVLANATVFLPMAPSLFGASVRPQPKPATASATLSPPTFAAIPADSNSSFEPPDTGSQTPSAATAASATLIPAAPQRPASLITAVATSRDGKHRLERRKGSQVTLVNDRSGWRLDLSTHGILCVAFTAESRSFITGHSDGLVRRWDSETGGLISSLKGSSDAVWSIDVTEAAEGDSRVAAGARDGSVVVWQLSSGDEIARLPPGESSVSCLRWSPGGDRLAVSFGDFSNREQNRLLVWSPLDHQALIQMPVDNSIAALQWLANDEGLVSANWQGEETLWQPGSDAPRSTAPLGDGGKQRAEAANWSADCPLLVAASLIN